ncbi:MAG TPA: HAMP domain-containing protein [Chloroflexi bacterium]|nr:HAMP domain-containing protein [Chloroflexota bacterium]
MRLNTKLLITYAIAGVLLLAVMGYYTGITVHRDKFQSIYDNFVSQLYQVDFALTSFLAGVEYDVLDLVANEAVRTRDDGAFTNFLDADEATFEYHIGETEQAIIDLFNAYRTNHPYVNSVYMGRENGSFVRSHKRARPTQYDPRQRPWYELAVSSPDRVMRTTPYPSVTTPDVNIGTVKALVDEEGQVYGVVGIDITLRNLTDYISEVSVGQGSTILLLDDQGIILTGEEPGITPTGGDQGLHFQSYQEAGLDHFQTVMDNVEGYITFEQEGERYYAFYYTSPALGWKIVAIVSIRTIDSQVNSYVISVLLMLTLSLLLFSVLTALGVRYLIVRPVARLQLSAETIVRTGDLSHPVAITSHDEVGQLAAAFNEMVASISRAHDELEMRVAERTADLEARNAELDAFAHTVAHDLKNPISIIVGYAEVLVHDYASILDGTLEHSLRMLVKGAHKLNAIVDGLLLLASVRQEKVEMHPLDMARIVDGARERLLYLIEKPEDEIALPDDWPAALGYGPWVEEVWVNYISNALKYGGRPARVELGYATEPGSQQIRFWVRDNGPGLSAEEQARLFTPFERLHQVDVPGHGLGLSIVQRIVQRLGGEVGVVCEVGHGCTFYFTLPAAPL